MSFGRIREEVDHMLRDLHFEDKKNTIARNLSGGMKRKLRCLYTYYCTSIHIQHSLQTTLKAHVYTTYMYLHTIVRT